MEPEHNNQETPPVAQPQINQLNQVTPLSKYLAMALFVILPFVGGYIGYMFAPEKVVEVEKEVVKEVERSISGSAMISTSSDQVELYSSTETSSATYEDITMGPCPFDNPPEQSTNKFYSRGDIVCYQGRQADVDPGSFAQIYVQPYDYIATFGTSSEQVARFAHDNNGFYVDGQRVFGRVSGEYEILDSHYFRVKDTIYAEKGAGLQREGGYIQVVFADPATFSVLGSDYAKDKSRVFYDGVYLPADVSSFQINDYSYGPGDFYPGGSLLLGQDQNAVYYRGEKLDGIDPSSVEVSPGAEYIFDSDTIFFKRSLCDSHYYELGEFSDIENYNPGC